MGVCSCNGTYKLCGGVCIPSTNCCTAADCTAITGQTCQSGSCACPTGQKVCDTACIANADCCHDVDCTIAGQVCLARTCQAEPPDAGEPDGGEPDVGAPDVGVPVSDAGEPDGGEPGADAGPDGGPAPADAHVGPPAYNLGGCGCSQAAGLEVLAALGLASLLLRRQRGRRP